MKFAFIAKHRHVWPVSWLCEALDASPPASTPGFVEGQALARRRTKG